MSFNRTDRTLTKDGTTSIPLYFKIESLMKNKILCGQLEPGDKLPTEADLTEKFGVSQITVRKALSNLEREGLIIRNRAKGTFVAETIPMRKKFVITNKVYNILKDADRYEIKNVDLKIIKVKETRNARMVRGFFNLTNEDSICVVQRTRLWKGIPMYYIENIISPSLASHLTLKELREKHLLMILEEKMGLTLGRGEMYIEAVPADPDVANILSMQIFEPLILRELYYWFPTGEPFEIVDSYMRPDYFRYKVDLDMKSLFGP
jgi:GntR family transcriptional regulator